MKENHIERLIPTDWEWLSLSPGRRCFGSELKVQLSKKKRTLRAANFYCGLHGSLPLHTLYRKKGNPLNTNFIMK